MNGWCDNPGMSNDSPTLIEMILLEKHRLELENDRLRDEVIRLKHELRRLREQHDQPLPDPKNAP
jgi:hypothetical protein